MQRKVLPDILKGVAVILMIQVHVMELFLLPEVYGSTFGKASLFLGGIPAAPVFMSIMGYFAAYSHQSMYKQILRGLKLILLGLLLNIGLNMHLLIRIWTGDLQIDPFAYIFGADILFVAGLSLIFVSILRALSGRNIWVYLFFTVLIPLGSDLFPNDFMLDGMQQYLMAFVISNADWSYFPFLPWAAWVLAGYSYALVEERFGISEIIAKYSGWLIVILGIPLILSSHWAVKITTDLPRYYHHGLLFFLWGLAFMVIWIELFRIMHRISRKNQIFGYFAWLGRNVTLAYVIQWLIIGNTATAIFRTQPVWIYWISVLLVLLATTLLIILLASPVRSLKNKLR
ncbi:MAG: heparan-alpha-glucosaminide N-acetyltransferase domain-containing protein [Bacteroidales bacterium]|jgi:hypothetical protein|nr:heparan-alpha-glucosaminide N-acetyltransferase domain-containing protein [Bacteroidales bacterium]